MSRKHLGWICALWMTVGCAAEQLETQQETTQQDENDPDGGAGLTPDSGNGGTGGGGPDTCAELFTTLQARLDAAVTAQGVPGASAYVQSGGCEWEGAAGTSDSAMQEPMPVAPLYRVGSTTKTFVAAALLIEVAAGNVELADSIDTYVAGVPNGEQITLEQVLNHTSGIYSYTDSDSFWNKAFDEPNRQWQPSELLHIATQNQPYFPPGASWYYSNTNYIVAGLVLEAVTGKPVAQAIRDHIVVPLALDETWFDGEEAASGTLTPGLDPYMGNVYDVTDYIDISTAWAAGAVASSNRDIATFMTALADGQLLDATHLALMMDFVSIGDGWGYGLGLVQIPAEGGAGIGHGGDIFGYSSDIRRYRNQDVTVAHFVNAMNAQARDAVTDALVDVVLP